MVYNRTWRLYPGPLYFACDNLTTSSKYGSNIQGVGNLEIYLDNNNYVIEIIDYYINATDVIYALDLEIFDSVSRNIRITENYDVSSTMTYDGIFTVES